MVYAMTHPDGVVHTVCQYPNGLSEKAIADYDGHIIEVDSFDETLIGKIYDPKTNQFVTVPKA
ncbi:hypothetical protein [Paenibacillus tyrfis]|uniref:Uncharacterized protein n=1 Tax=Paenibacillus tyrfis TaxID=1501230 RepID=A0A081NYB4_9BACL|nr:hypothetical protein [Paenibacillus tyrfis]KEQ23437.1 hypothetical protein ET33_16565 [Paenibacillus tyrfis]